MRASQQVDARALRILVNEVGIQEVTNICAVICAANKHEASAWSEVVAEAWDRAGLELSQAADRMPGNL